MASQWLVQEEDLQQAVTLLSDDGTKLEAEVDGQRLTLTLHPMPDGRIEVRQRGGDPTGRPRRLRLVREDGAWLVVEGGEQRRYEIRDARADWLNRGGADGPGAGGGEVRASMPGRVVGLPLAVGAEVAVGDVVAVLEAMKMENDVRAKIAGTIATIQVREGDAVEARALLLTIAAAAAP